MNRYLCADEMLLAAGSVIALLCDWWRKQEQQDKKRQQESQTSVANWATLSLDLAAVQTPLVT